jgi:hypothetical protein
MKSVKTTRNKTEEQEQEQEWTYRDEILSSAILPACSLSRSVSKIYWSGSIKADMMDWNCRYKATAPAVSTPVTNTRNAIAEAEHDLQRRRWRDRRRARSPLAIALFSLSLSLSLSLSFLCSKSKRRFLIPRRRRRAQRRTRFCASLAAHGVTAWKMATRISTVQFCSRKRLVNSRRIGSE